MYKRSVLYCLASVDAIGGRPFILEFWSPFGGFQMFRNQSLFTPSQQFHMTADQFLDEAAVEYSTSQVEGLRS